MTKNQKLRADLARIGDPMAPSACRYLHVSALVGMSKATMHSLPTPMQTPKGKGATARRAPAVKP